MRIKEPTWSRLDDDTKKSWTGESSCNKEKNIAQFMVNFKSSAPVTKTQNLCIVYRTEFGDSDGCESGFTANSEG